MDYKTEHELLRSMVRDMAQYLDSRTAKEASEHTQFVWEWCEDAWEHAFTDKEKEAYLKSKNSDHDR